MAKTPDPRDKKKPEPRPVREKKADRSNPPKPAPKKVFSDWAMI
jgi:hypothetical protein